MRMASLTDKEAPDSPRRCWGHFSFESSVFVRRKGEIWPHLLEEIVEAVCREIDCPCSRESEGGNPSLGDEEARGGWVIALERGELTISRGTLP